MQGDVNAFERLSNKRAIAHILFSISPAREEKKKQNKKADYHLIIISVYRFGYGSVWPMARL